MKPDMSHVRSSKYLTTFTEVLNQSSPYAGLSLNFQTVILLVFAPVILTLIQSNRLRHWEWTLSVNTK